jgi:hypothetical protein
MAIIPDVRALKFGMSVLSGSGDVGKQVQHHGPAREVACASGWDIPRQIAALLKSAVCGFLCAMCGVLCAVCCILCGVSYAGISPSGG